MARKKTFVEVRKKHKISQLLLSRRAGVKTYRISRAECGYEAFTEKEKLKVAEVLGVKVRGVLWTDSQTSKI